MYAIFVLSIDRAVALGTGLRHPITRVGQQLLRYRIGQAPNRVRAVAVGADGGVDIARLLRTAVNAVIRFLILIRVALLAQRNQL